MLSVLIFCVYQISIPISSSSLVTVMTTAKENFHVPNLLLFYFVHKNIA